MEYIEATEVESLRKLNTRQLLTELALKDKDSDHFHCFITSLTRIVAAKPHSADVERLINVYNKLKSNDRASLSPGTIKNYLHVSQNMGDMETFDPFASSPRLARNKMQKKVARKSKATRIVFGRLSRSLPCQRTKKDVDKQMKIRGM